MAEGGVKPNVSQQVLVTNENLDMKFISTRCGEVVSTMASSSASGERRITTQQGISVAILCFLNLINNMDQFVLAGESRAIINTNRLF